MITENLSTLKIHKLTQEQYDRELAAGNIDGNAIYLTPDEEIDLSGCSTATNLVNGEGTGALKQSTAMEASGLDSFAIGSGTVAKEKNVNVSGQYNLYSEETLTIQTTRKTGRRAYDATVYRITGYTFNQELGTFEISNMFSTTMHALSPNTLFSFNYTTTGYLSSVCKCISNEEDTNNSNYYRFSYEQYDIVETTTVNGEYSHIVGNGKSDASRSNAYTLDWDGNAWFAGDVYVGSISGTNKDEGSVKLQREITGAAGDFVVIGDDGNVTTKTIPYAEEASF